MVIKRSDFIIFLLNFLHNRLAEKLPVEGSEVDMIDNSWMIIQDNLAHIENALKLFKEEKEGGEKNV